MSPAVRKALRALGLLAYAGAAAVLFVVASYAAFSLFVRSGATPVPDVGGLEVEEARSRIADSGLELAVADDGRFSPQVPAGRVLEQDPSPRTLAKRGSTVRTVLSLGPQKVEVPDLTGRSFQAAQVALASGDLTLGRTLQVYSGASPAGTVVEQSPSPGAAAPPDGAVDLYLAKGGAARRYVMPDLVYLDYELVRPFFESAGLRLGRVTFEIYEGVREGTVLRQFPLAGHPITPRDAVSLVVAAGPEAAAEAPERVSPGAAGPTPGGGTS